MKNSVNVIVDKEMSNSNPSEIVGIKAPEKSVVGIMNVQIDYKTQYKQDVLAAVVGYTHNKLPSKRHRRSYGLPGALLKGLQCVSQWKPL